MEWGDVGLVLLIALALWVFVVERYTPLRLEDGVRLGADSVRAAWRRVSPLVLWVAYDVIIGREREDVVKDLQPEPAAPLDHKAADARTDGRTDGADAPAAPVPRLRLDRTRAAVIEELLTHGWRVEEIRAVIKGENAAIGAEVQAARERLAAAGQPSSRYRPITEEQQQFREEMGLPAR